MSSYQAPAEHVFLPLSSEVKDCNHVLEMLGGVDQLQCSQWPRDRYSRVAFKGAVGADVGHACNAGVDGRRA